MPIINSSITQTAKADVFNYNISTDYNKYELIHTPFESISGQLLIGGLYTSNLPVSANGKNISASMNSAYLYDFYDRIHITPQLIALGNLVSSQTRDIGVWNAYLTPKQLLSVGLQNADGISVNLQTDPPIYYGALQEQIHIVSISTVGSISIDTFIAFVFEAPTIGPKARITGNRVVVSSFKPLAEFVETLEWRTDIIKSVAGEQRIALREAARQSFDYDFFFESETFAKAKAMASARSFYPYAVPIWGEAEKASTINTGDTVIFVNTLFSDFRVDSLIAIYTDSSNVEAGEILSLANDSITLKLPVTGQYTNASVAPMRLALTLEGFKFNRKVADHVNASASYTVTDNINLAGTSPFPQYSGLDVFNKPTVLISSANERIYQSMDVFDNGSGIIELDTISDFIDKTYTVSWFTETLQERWIMRKWLHKIKGRLKAFWLPSWNHDIELDSTVEATAVSMLIKPIGYEAYLGRTDIMIELIDGSTFYRKVLSGSIVGYRESLSIETSLGVQVTPETVRRICFMSKVRFDTDSVSINYQLPKIATFSANVKEIQL